MKKINNNRLDKKVGSLVGLKIMELKDIGIRPQYICLSYLLMGRVPDPPQKSLLVFKLVDQYMFFPLQPKALPVLFSLTVRHL